MRRIREILSRRLPLSSTLAIDALRTGRLPFRRSKLLYRSAEDVELSSFPKFWILGCGRSGNTLLRRRFVAEYSILIPPELPVIRSMAYTAARRPWSSKHDLWAFCRQFLVDLPRVEQDLGGKTLFDEDRTSAPAEAVLSLRQAVALLFAQYLRTIGFEVGSDTVVADKTPTNVFNIEIILKMDPAARFIVMIRDPSDVARSYWEAQLVTAPGPKSGIAYWRDTMFVVRRLVDRGLLHRDNCIVVRFESLAAQQDQVVSQVAGFLGIDAKGSTDANEPRYRAMFADLERPHHESARAGVRVYRGASKELSEAELGVRRGDHADYASLASLASIRLI